MGVPGNANALLLKQAAAAAGGYEISRSVRFSSSNSAFLSRTPGSAGNRKTWTWAGYVKRCRFGNYEHIFSGTGSSPSYAQFYWSPTEQLVFDNGGSGAITTTQVFRDPSAWYHIVLTFDTTQGTAADRMRMYANGQQITTFSSSSYPTQNSDGGMNQASSHNIAKEPNSASSGFYLADIHFIDGQALDPTSFGEFDTNGVWQPIDYAGTFGTNGFHLPFSDNSTAAALGTDTSSNGNDWTVNNISVAAGAGNDSLVDSPTNGSQVDTGAGGEVVGNYCTLNPVIPSSIRNTSASSLTNGNLDYGLINNQTDDAYDYATIGVTSGKWFYEVTLNTVGDGTSHNIGWSGDISRTWTNKCQYRFRAGDIYKNGAQSTTGLATSGAGDVVGVALDADAGSVSFYKNGTLLATETSFAKSIYYPHIYGEAGTSRFYTASYNFGQRPFAYTAPSGFKALCTTNLPEPTIADGSTAMDVALYTGNGSTQTISGLNFSPDLVWIKSRSNTQDHYVFDFIRDSGILRTNTTGAETTGTDYIDYNSDGFVSKNGLSSNGYTYVAWTWDAGSSTVTNTSGTISSQVRANASAGFSVVTFTGNGTQGATIGHGCGTVPEFIILKKLTTADWEIYHSSVGAGKGLEFTTGAAFTSSAYWPSTPTSSVISLGNNSGINQNSSNYIVYAWSPVAGYSSFGSYTGNGSADGPFVFTGFRSRWVMVKRTDAAYGWYMYDTARDTYNIAGEVLLANASDAEVSDSDLDILSNGFKPRRSSNAFNASGGTFIYIAFAESPFAYARAR